MQKQTIEIVLGKGVQTKVDPRLVGNEALLTLENASLARVGAISKRNGFTSLPIYVNLNSLPFVAGTALNEYRDELVAVAKTTGNSPQLHTFSDTYNRWKAKGLCVPVQIHTERILSPHVPSGGAPSFPEHNWSYQLDTAILNGIQVIVGRYQTGVFASVIDTTTGAYIVNGSQLHSGNTNYPRVVAIDTRYICVISSTSSGQIRLYTLDTNNPWDGLLPAVTLTSSAVTDSEIAVGVISTGVGVVAYEDSSNRVAVLTFNNNSKLKGPTVAASENPSTIGLVTEAVSGKVHVCYLNTSTNNIRSVILTSGLSVSTAAFTVDTSMSAATRPTGYEIATGMVQWFWNAVSSESGGSFRYIKSAIVFNGSVLTAAYVYLRQGLMLASQPFRYNGNAYMLTMVSAGEVGAAINSYQPTYFLVSLEDAKPVARILDGQAVFEDQTGYIHGTLRPGSVATMADGTFQIVLGATYAGNEDRGNDTYPTPTRVTMDFSKTPEAVRHGENLFITGGQLWEYDGHGVFENNFHLFPELTEYTASASGGSLSDGTYQVTAVFSEMDAHGQKHVSGVAPAMTVTLSGGGSSQSFTVYGTSYYHLCRKPNGVRIEWFITEASGTTFYRNMLVISDASDVNSETTSFTTVNTSAPVVYTTGGIVENGAVPAPRSLCSSGKRLFAYCGNGQVYYSKEAVSQEPTSFSPFLVHTVSCADDRKTVRLADMDGRIIVLSEDGIQFFYGEGPTETGTNGSFSAAQSVATDIGLAPDSPAISTDQGVMFKSPKGIYLLNRSLQVEYIGAPVDAYNDLTITSASLVEDKQEVRFFSDEGTVLVFDYFNKQWNVFTGLDAVDSTIWDGQLTLLQSDGTILIEDPDSFRDNGQAIDLLAETNWIKLNGTQGEMRVFHVNLLAEWRSAHTLTMEVFADYDETAIETVTLNASSGYSSGDILQLRQHIGRKCQSIKFRISDSNQSGTGESCSLIALQLEVGLRKGTHKTASAGSVT